MRKESQFSRRDFLQVMGAAGLAAGMPRSLLKERDWGEEEWPELTWEQFPEEMEVVRRIGQMSPKVEIGDDGFLKGEKTDFSLENEPPEGDERFNGVGEELACEIGGSKLSWVVLLQKKSEDPADKVKDPVVDSHFLVNKSKILQTYVPSERGWPRSVSQIRFFYWKDSNRFVELMRGLTYYKQWGETFNPVLLRVFDQEPKAYAYRRTLVVEVDGEVGGKMERTPERLKANLLSTIRSLRKYGLGPWDVVCNMEMYERYSDLNKDIGVKLMAEMRHLWGIMALIEGDEREKELVFGGFRKSGESKLEAVKRYFRLNREYLDLIYMPQEMQEWDKDSKFWFLWDVLNGEKMPVADGFVMPVEHDSGGGLRFLDQDAHSKETFHLGYDFNVGSGNEDGGMPFRCVAKGKVVWQGWTTNGLGKIIIVRHRLRDGREVYSRYAHNEENFVKKGEVVEAGQKIGTIGRTGQAENEDFKAHLHFEIAYASTYQRLMRDNPAFYGVKSKDLARRMFAAPREFIKQNCSLKPKDATENSKEMEREWGDLLKVIK